MAEWSFLEHDFPNQAFDAFSYQFYEDREIQPAPAQCRQAQAQPYQCPSPSLTALLATTDQGTQQLCEYNPTPKVENPRELRNKAEKQRRDKMNESVARLASIVPPVIKPGRKMNKRNVLRLAAHYLRSHQHVFGNSIDRGPEFSSSFTQALLKNLKGFLITTTYKGIVVVVSPNIQEFLGYTELELLGQDVFSIIHKDDHRLLAEQLFPRSCNLTANGRLLLPKGKDAAQNVAEALSNEKRSFIIRFKKSHHQRSEPPQYVTCHVEGSLRKSDCAGTRFDQVIQIGRRARSRGENRGTFCSGNDIVFVGMVRPAIDTFLNESGLESFRMEYRTRHSIDGEIIQCEQRIALVTGYMIHEVNGVNAMNFMHRDDVRWVIIALREMYDQHRLVGESCYRLMTKNGKFIYMKTQGRLDVDKDTKAVTSFVCTNTVVAEKEGKHLIKLMKRKFTLMINNGEPADFDDEEHEEDTKQSLPVEDPRQLEKVILHLVTNLPSPQPEDTLHNCSTNGERSPPHLAIIPPQRERIQRAIEKSYSVIKTIDISGNRNWKSNNNLPRSDNKSGRVTHNQTMELATDEDHSDIIRALCMGICQGPPCTCIPEAEEPPEVDINALLAPNEDKPIQSYGKENAPAANNVAEVNLTNPNDPHNEPADFNIPEPKTYSTLEVQNKTPHSEFTSRNFEITVGTEETITGTPAEQVTSNPVEAAALSYPPPYIQELHRVPSPTFRVPVANVEPTSGSSVEDSFDLERGNIPASNTILGDDELIRTIDRIEAEDGVDSRNLTIDDVFFESDDEDIPSTSQIKKRKSNEEATTSRGPNSSPLDIYEFRDDDVN